MNGEMIERVVGEMTELYTQLRGLTASRAAKAIGPMKKWYELAVEIVSRGINPRRYVRWVYDHFRRTNPDVYASMVTSMKMFRVFTENHTNYEAEVRLAIQLQADTLRQQLALGRSPQEIIEDSFLELGPVFKYALAKKHGLADYEEQLRGAAELEVACEPLYQSLLGPLMRSAENARSVGYHAEHQQPRDAHTHADVRDPMPGGGTDSD